MANQSKIEWTDATWNPVTGCTRVSAGCDHCYAVRETHRHASTSPERYGGLTVLNGRGDRHFNGVVRCHEDKLEVPLRWRKPRKVFVNSMSDLFHESVPVEFITKVFAVMAMTQRHTYQILTKRPARMAEVCVAKPWFAKAASSVTGDDTFCCSYSILPNVWLGTSIEDQKTANERIPHLLKCTAAVRFLSVEPMLEGIDLKLPKEDPHGRCSRCGATWPYAKTKPPRHECPAQFGATLDWVIVGGESGPKSRPMHPQWARSIRDQCRASDIPFFFKQWGDWAPVSDERDRDLFVWPSGITHPVVWPSGTKRPPPESLYGSDARMRRVGKKRAGRLLDGRSYDQMPPVAASAMEVVA